ncbi:acyl-CoA thioesterase [Candidatus Bipolaricaulota bacterium]|nr:acyl-CoA thioesterase [Candidatus Bipolaricaulota bacterium]
MRSSQPEGVFRHEFVVPEAVIDANGHANNVAYLRWMIDVAVKHFHPSGSADAMHEAGSSWVVRSHRIEYLRPALLDDRIEASTWIVNFSRVRSLRRYQFVRVSDGAVLARGETDWVFINAETGRPRSIPEEIKAAFTLVPDEEP